MTDLHARLTAEIERREAALATWQATPVSLWEITDHAVDGLVPRHGWTTAGAYSALASFHDEGDIQRRYTHYRRILERHRPPKDGGHGPDGTIWCGGCMRYGCRELPDLADALNIPHTQDQP